MSEVNRKHTKNPANNLSGAGKLCAHNYNYCSMKVWCIKSTSNIETAQIQILLRPLSNQFRFSFYHLVTVMLLLLSQLTRGKGSSIIPVVLGKIKLFYLGRDCFQTISNKEANYKEKGPVGAA